MKTFLLLLLSCLVILSVQSCRDKDEPEYECTPDITVPFPQDALDRFYFKTGTWWVYEEINNPGMEDSVWVVDYRKNTLAVNGEELRKVFGHIKTKKCYDNYNTGINSVRHGEFRFFLQIYSPYDGFGYEKELFEIIEQPKGNEYINRSMLYGNSYTSQTNFGNNTTIVDSITVKKITYYEVLHFENTQSVFDYLQEAWYVRNMGLVKFKRTDGSEWELVRYSIVQ